jgi:hypothetical protein
MYGVADCVAVYISLSRRELYSDRERSYLTTFRLQHTVSRDIYLNCNRKLEDRQGQD